MVFDDALQHGCGGRGTLAGFEDRGVAGCNGANEGPDGELDGEVVGSIVKD